jgi:hypothetical protein
MSSSSSSSQSLAHSRHAKNADELSQVMGLTIVSVSISVSLPVFVGVQTHGTIQLNRTQGCRNGKIRGTGESNMDKWLQWKGWGLEGTWNLQAEVFNSSTVCLARSFLQKRFQ